MFKQFGCGACQVSFGNGRIEEFYVACNCLSAEQMAEADVARALAAAMASFHFESLLHLPPGEATEPQASWCCQLQRLCPCQLTSRGADL